MAIINDPFPDEMKRAIKPLRILLIFPPIEGVVVSLLPQVNSETDGIGFKPPVGLLSIATTVKAFSEHKIKVVDSPAQKMGIGDVVETVENFQPDVVGISAWTDFWFPAFTLGKTIKEKFPDIHLVYGGPHVCIYPEETLNIPFVDSVIACDGEFPFLYLCNMVANSFFSSNIPGLHIKSVGMKNGGERFFIQKDLDKLPIPDRALLPLNLYTSVLGKTNKITTMITSRGCPFKCIFCKLNFQKTVCHSAEHVVEEFKQIQDSGISEVEVYDDTFTWSKERVQKICLGLIDCGIKVEWAIRDRVTNADPDLLNLMYRAGCRRVHYGIESGVDRVLKRINKKITTQQARNAVSMAKSAGMKVLTYFMIGNMDETIEDMRKTIDFALELNSDYAEFSIAIPYPGTAMYEEALSSGLIKSDYWKEYAMNPKADFVLPQVIENNAGMKTLIHLRNEAIKRFYFSPRFIMRQVKEIRSYNEFSKKAKMGVQLLKSMLADKK